MSPLQQEINTVISFQNVPGGDPYVLCEKNAPVKKRPRAFSKVL